MAVSNTSGDMGFVRQVSVILKEGNVTAGSGYSPYGKTTTFGFASEISNGDPVALSPDTANTCEATGGNFVVAPLANGVDLCIGPVSYTHLRAHETDSYLVCRLLLEKKKK